MSSVLILCFPVLFLPDYYIEGLGMGNGQCSFGRQRTQSQQLGVSDHRNQLSVRRPLPPVTSIKCRASFIRIGALNEPNQADQEVEEEQWCGEMLNMDDFPIMKTVLTSKKIQGDESSEGKIAVNWGSFSRLKNKTYLEEYVYVKQLGKGSKGSVVKVKSKFGLNIMRAIKVIKENLFMKSSKKRTKLMAQITIPFELDHPNIVKVHEVFEWRSNIGIVMELCEGGDLVNYMQKSKKFSEADAGKLFRQIMGAVYYMHSRRVCHRELKPENMLYDTETKLLKIIDFESASRFTPDKKMQSLIGSLYYTAPQMFEGQCDQKCDIWSCGIILHVMMCGSPPFEARKKQELIDKIQNQAVGFTDRSWANRSEQVKQLVTRMLNKDPSKRPSAQQVLGSNWVMGQYRINRPLRTMIGGDILGNLRNFHFKNKLKAVVYTFIASQLYDGQNKQSLMSAFREIDKDGDGVIGVDELQEIFESQVDSSLTKQDLKRIVNTVDTNGSGRIDFTEFIVAATNEDELLRERELECAFNYLDSDHSGYITFEEVAAFLDGKDQTTEQIKAIFEEVDDNGDGKINKKEFIALLTGKEIKDIDE